MANKLVRRKRLPFWALCYFKSDKTTVIMNTRYFESQTVSVDEVVKCDTTWMSNNKKVKTFDEVKVLAMHGK